MKDALVVIARAVASSCANTHSFARADLQVRGKSYFSIRVAGYRYADASR